MKKIYLGLLVGLGILLVSCASGPEEQRVLPTLVPGANLNGKLTEEPEEIIYPIGTATPAMSVTDVPEVTEEPDATVTKEPGATEEPEPTKALKPTKAPEPTVTPKPTKTPEPTATPKLTATPKPTKAPEPTATPKPASDSETVAPEIHNLLARADKFKNTVIRGTVYTSEEEINRHIREMTIGYSSFGVIAENASDLHSAKEYMELYPEIEKLNIDKIEIYDNGYLVYISGVVTVYDANLCYAIRTGDKSVLSETEKEILSYLNDVTEKTKSKKLSRVEAVKALHDYLVTELEYDMNFREASHTPEGVMRNRTAVCDGYARTMRLLLLMSGIESKIVGGTSKGVAHAWNLVKMEDGWYHVDVTWDDPTPDVKGKISYIYFLKNDVEMATTHVWNSEIVCNGTAYAVYAYRDVLCDSYETLRSVYEKQIQSETYLVFCYPKGGSLTQDVIVDFLKTELRTAFSYYPETELTDYYVLEIVNPLLVK